MAGSSGNLLHYFECNILVGQNYEFPILRGFVCTKYLAAAVLSAFISAQRPAFSLSVSAETMQHVFLYHI